ncbi:uncharacterized protein [Diadema setosum]|uniref:uncharacterized protein n=1 Tax=Diadema setosum TaxID=31175 RepID=UPI003B3ABACE
MRITVLTCAILWCGIVSVIDCVDAVNEDNDIADLTDMCPVEEEIEEDEKTCGVPEHPCDSNPCQNGGTCYEKFSSLVYYRCFCTPEWIGLFCETVATTRKPPRPQYKGRYIPCFTNKFTDDGICFDDLYDV